MVLLELEVGEHSVAEVANAIQFVIILREFALVVRALLADRFVALSAVVPADALELAERPIAQLAVVEQIKLLFIFPEVCIGKVRVHRQLVEEAPSSLQGVELLQRASLVHEAKPNRLSEVRPRRIPLVGTSNELTTIGHDGPR